MGPTSFTLFTNDLPTSVRAESVYMFADDNTIYEIYRRKGYCATNTALHELYDWCLINRLSPYPDKSEAMLNARSPPDLIPWIFIGSSLTPARDDG